MSTTFSGKAELKVDFRVTNTGSAASWTEAARFGTSLLPEWTLPLTNGTSADQCQKVYVKSHTIANSSSVTIDLNAAAGDITGLGTIDFANIKVVIIRLRSPVTTKKVVVGNAASNPWAPWLSASTTTWDVADLFVIDAPDDGFTVGATANLKIANSSGVSCVVDVILAGH